MIFNSQKPTKSGEKSYPKQTNKQKNSPLPKCIEKEYFRTVFIGNKFTEVFSTSVAKSKEFVVQRLDTKNKIISSRNSWKINIHQRKQQFQHIFMKIKVWSGKGWPGFPQEFCQQSLKSVILSDGQFHSFPT